MFSKNENKTKYSKLISFNCKNFKTSVEDIRELCKISNIVCLQETWLLSHDIPLLGTVSNEFDYTGKSAVDTSAGILRGRPYGGVAILWRKGMFDSVSIIECQTILVFSVYMPTKSYENLPIFTEVLSEISAVETSSNVESVYVLGDFNAHPYELFYTELSSFCSDRSWKCTDVEMLKADTYTYTDLHHGSRSWLDHCVDMFVSDHLPIYLECNLDIVRPRRTTLDVQRSTVIWGERNESQINAYRELCHNGLRQIDFPPELAECSHGLCDVTSHRLILDDFYEQIVNKLKEASSKTKIMTSTNDRPRRNRTLCGWNKNVRDAHREARLRFLIWVLHNKPSSGAIYEQMNDSRKIFKSRLKWCINHQEQIRMDKIAKLRAEKKFSKFWKSTGKLDVRPGLPVSVDGESDPGKIANLFMKHFKVPSALGPSTGLPGTRPVVRGDAQMLMFTASQVRNVIKRMSRGKSPGHDGLSIEHLKNAGVHLPRVLSLFFNMCIRHSYLPSDLMKTIIVPIVKNRTGDISDRGNYRPISLATTVAKVLDSLLDPCLDKYLNLHDAQFGFRPGLSTESAILSLKHTVQYYTNRKTPVYACFLDLSKAFDLVSYDVLWRKMESRGIPAEILTIFRYWYANQLNFVKWSNKLSEAYRLECGVRQGGLSSPKLFNLYVNDLIVELSSMRVGCKVGGVSVNNISYADDMVLLSPTARAIGEMLNVCENFAMTHGLVYNVKKSEYIFFKVAGKSHEFIPPIYLSGVKLNRVFQFKYLGHILTDDLKDDLDVERERRALAVRGNMLARRFARCSDQVKITLFKAYCQGLYTGALWISCAKKSLNTLRIQYNNIFRMMMRLPRYCSASEMFAQRQTDGFQAIVRKKVASLVRRVRESGNSILRIVADDLHAPILRHFMRTMNEIGSGSHGVPLRYMTQ
ncbi:hypothetical protein ABMA28_007258 [Loxostege sticticalis]|uniref:Reverse transcriptase domain-containing protein n=1 Tax=Loxostege sticticalis TaxID=481309 RepID=A0ABD0TQ59_LOXSC